jgi:hypothetical protein
LQQKNIFLKNKKNWKKVQKGPILGFFALFENFRKLTKISTFWPPKIWLFLKILILPKWI